MQVSRFSADNLTLSNERFTPFNRWARRKSFPRNPLRGNAAYI
jgi:hypothetical protein